MEIAGFVAMSHAPFWPVDFNHRGPGENYVAAVAATRERVEALDADVLIVFGPDHVRNFFYDAMPPFCIGADQVDGFGDYGSLKGPLPGAADLGRHVVEQVMAAGFDPSISLKMGIDHGISQPFAALAGGAHTRILPIMINCNGAAMPSIRRCHAFGAALGRAVRSFPGPGRAVVVGSGGMSHSPPSASPYDPAVSPVHRDYVISGRWRVVEHSAALEVKLAELKSNSIVGPVNQPWDEWFLGRMKANDLEALLALTDDDILRDGGTGAHELRTWIAALGTWGGAIDTVAYEPVPSWITGMGCVSAAA